MKTPNVYIMNGDIPVAKLIDNKMVRINFEVEAPADLFGIGYDEQTEVPFAKYYKWVSTRTFPYTRIGRDILLKKMGLERYNAVEQALTTKCKMAQDSFWLKIGDDNE